jgi:hypothetical protein
VLAARREVSSLALCSKDGEAASVCADGRRVELQTRLFHGGVSRQWQVCIQGHWGLGRVPGRWFLSVCFISSKMAGVYCGSTQSLLAMELWLTYGWWRLASGDGRRRWNLEDSGCRGSKDWIAISLFFRDLCAFSSVPLSTYLYLYESLYGILNYQYRYVGKKKLRTWEKTAVAMHGVAAQREAANRGGVA